MVLYLVINLVALLLQFAAAPSWQVAPRGRHVVAGVQRSWQIQRFETGIMTNEIDSLSHFGPPPAGSPLQR